VSASIRIENGDGCRGVIFADAHVDDAIIKMDLDGRRQQARRGRRPARA